MTRGRFITLEGGEGSGKTTQCALLEQALTARGLAVLRTREPGGSPGGELLRSILLDGAIHWDGRAETLLHFAARADHLAKVIGPALAAGTWVICDRFFDSTLAYQGYGQGTERSFINALIGLVEVVPDLTIVLDVAEALANLRMQQRMATADRYERQDAAFHRRVRQGFREIAAGSPRRCVMLEASGDVQAVHTAVMSIVGSRLATDL